MTTSTGSTSSSHKICEAVTDEEIRACFPVIHELRPHILGKDELLPLVKLQRNEGYHLMYIKDTVNDQSEPAVVSIMGYRIHHCLFYGRQLYIDDLCTLSTGAKKKGYAGALLDWAISHAKQEKCAVVTLDSGYQRADAHRLYMNKRFVTHCHHFMHKIDNN